MRSARRTRNIIPIVLAAIAAISLPLHTDISRGAEKPADAAAASVPGSDSGAKLDTVTIEARRSQHRVRSLSHRHGAAPGAQPMAVSRARGAP